MLLHMLDHLGSHLDTKYKGHKPEMYGDGTVYTNEEIIEELKKDEWLQDSGEEDMP